MKKLVAPLILVLAIFLLSAPAMAGSKKIRHKGEIVGVEGSEVSLRVGVKKGKPRKVSKFKASGVPTHCDAGQSVFAFKALNPTKVTNKGNFKEVLKNPDGSKLTISGTVRKRGKKVSGFVKTNKFDGGEQAGTCKVPRVAFKTAKA